MKKNIHFINNQYPSIPDLYAKPKNKIQKSLLSILNSGYKDDVNLHKNKTRIKEVDLKYSINYPTKIQFF